VERLDESFVWGVSVTPKFDARDLIVKRDAGGRGFVLALRRIEVVQGFERCGACVPKSEGMACVWYHAFVVWRREGGGSGVGRCLCRGSWVGIGCGGGGW
jgi:hypothetical protein